MSADLYRSLPAKRMSSGVLYLDDAGRILIVKPVYRPEWLLPGGVIEEAESPRAACARETREELGLEIEAQSLLCIDYTRSERDKSDSLQFVFYGGILTVEQIERCKLQAEELSEYRFVSTDDALLLLGVKAASRLPYCLRALSEGTIYYLEDGHLVPPDAPCK